LRSSKGQEVASEEKRPPCRLFFILARDAPRGVILRRGPTRWVRLIAWDTSNDTFEPGHWFKGRIYEHFCDLSPDGSLFIYLAAKYSREGVADNEYTHRWTAISKPPWLTALALWPIGDVNCGGGWFLDDRTVFLNHTPNVRKPHRDHKPRGLKVVGWWPPSHSLALAERCGWRRKRREVVRHTERRGLHGRALNFWEKTNEAWKASLVVLDAGPLLLIDWGRERKMALAGVQQADWDLENRLVYVKDGRLFAAEDLSDLADARLIADFNSQEPEPIAPPDWATHW